MLGIGKVIGSLFSGVADLLSALAKWAGYLFAFKWGQARERERQSAEIGRIKDEQLKILARKRRSREQLLERMRKHQRS